MARRILTSTTDPNLGNLYCYHLPKGLIKLTIQATPNGVQITTLEPEFIPDPNARYFFNYTPSPFTDDNISIEFGPNGFLKNIHTIIDDQTDELLSQIGDLANSAISGALGLPGKTRDVAAQNIILFEGTIDPLNEDHVKMVNQSFKGKMDELNLVFGVKDLTEQHSGKVVLSSEGQYGIFARPMGSYEISLSSSTGRLAKIIRLPDPEELHFIKIPNPSFVKTDFQIEFDDLGYPKSIKVTKPSSALAILKVPLNILSSILDLPAKLIQLRVNLDSQKANEIDKKLNLRTWEQKLEESDLELEKKKQAILKEKANSTEEDTRAVVEVNSEVNQKLNQVTEELGTVNGAIDFLQKRFTDIGRKLDALDKKMSSEDT
ncbi:MAG: hypothetical protein KDD63_06955 [Bacteroidetes bacterium]|nr:hypothetical protein [Bacteroidota bacterium]